MSDQAEFTKEEVIRLDKLLEGWPTMSKQEKSTAKTSYIADILDARQIAKDNKIYLTFFRGKFSSYLSAKNPSSTVRMPQGLKTSWTPYEAFGVVEEKKIYALRDELMAEAEKGAGKSSDKNKASDKDDTNAKRIGALNTAHSRLWHELDENQQLAYKNIADAWVEEGPDEEDRLKIATRRLPSWSKGIIDVAWKQAGAVCFFAFCYKDAEGVIQIARYDTSQLPGMKGLKFTEAQPNWEKTTMTSLARFAEDWLNPDQVAAPGTSESGETHLFEHYDDGTPILPDTKDGKPITDWETMRKILRPWFNENHALASGVPNTVVPWLKVIASPEEFFPEGLFENNILRSLKQPGQMHKETAVAVWNVIQALQARGDGSRFRFKSVLAGKDIVPAEYKPSVPLHKQKKGKNKVAAAPKIRLPPAYAKSPVGALPPGVQGPTLPPRPPRGRKRRSGGKGKGKARAIDDDSEEAKSSSDNDSSEDEPTLTDRSGTTMDEDHVRQDNTRTSRVRPDNARTSHVRPDNGSKPRPSNTRPRPPAPRAAVKSTNELIAMTSSMTIPPPQSLIDEAKYQPPTWVNGDDRVFPYLWALGPMPEYRALLTSWRHVMLRRLRLDPEIPVQWGSWKRDLVSCPVDVHESEITWNRVLNWIREGRPEKDKHSTPSEVQTWFLVAGMVIRDVLIATEIEPDCPVIGGAEYLHNSPAAIAHIENVLEPAAAGAHHLLPPPGSAMSVPAESGGNMRGTMSDIVKPGGPVITQPSVKKLKGQKGRPPGIRAAPPSTINTVKHLVEKASKDSDSEEEDVVMRDLTQNADSDGRASPHGSEPRASGSGEPTRASGSGAPTRASGSGAPTRASGSGAPTRASGGSAQARATPLPTTHEGLSRAQKPYVLLPHIADIMAARRSSTPPAAGLRVDDFGSQGSSSLQVDNARLGNEPGVQQTRQSPPAAFIGQPDVGGEPDVQMEDAEAEEGEPVAVAPRRSTRPRRPRQRTTG